MITPLLFSLLVLLITIVGVFINPDSKLAKALVIVNFCIVMFHSVILEKEIKNLTKDREEQVFTS